MKRRISLCALVFILVLLGPASAQAIVLNVVPDAVTVMAGDALQTDIIISGLGAGAAPSVGAFDLNVAFDQTILSPVDIIFGPFLGDPFLFEALTDFDFSIPGLVGFAEVSLLAPAALDALQASSFTLATISFSAIADGMSEFAFFGETRVDDAFGLKLSVPEPTTLALLALGLGGLSLTRRRKARSAAIEHAKANGRLVTLSEARK